ncbi:hypothetical protein [Streptomyces sp. NPDC054961]
MPLSSTQKHLIEKHLDNPESISAIILGLCWPNHSTLSDAANFTIKAGQTLGEASGALGWTPQWLLDAGYSAFDAHGTEITGASSVSGIVNWNPEVRTCRVHDAISDSEKPGSLPYRRRTSGEIALLALWTDAVNRNGIDLKRPDNLSGGARGALFRDLLMHYLQCSLPEGWQVRHEVPLTHIRGLHMRRDVGDRKSDILVTDSGSRLVAAISSKWSWRSDRGTEAAQMVPLTKYRPDVPYAMATAEFPRAASVPRESIEDRIYHLCPSWVGAWSAVIDLPKSGSPLAWPDLDTLRKQGDHAARTMAMNGLDKLTEDLRNSGNIL